MTDNNGCKALTYTINVDLTSPWFIVSAADGDKSWQSDRTGRCWIMHYKLYALAENKQRGIALLHFCHLAFGLLIFLPLYQGQRHHFIECNSREQYCLLSACQMRNSFALLSQPLSEYWRIKSVLKWRKICHCGYVSLPFSEPLEFHSVVKLCSAVILWTMKNPQSPSIKRWHGLDYGLPSVHILPQYAECDVKQYSIWCECRWC